MKEYEYQKNDKWAAVKRRRDLVMRMQQAKKLIDKEEREEQNKKQISPKLEIGEPNDKYEQEADAVAKKVVNGDDASTSMQKNNSSPEINMKEEEGTLMAKSEDGTLSGTEKLQTTLDSSKGSGQALDDKTKSEMGDKMGTDLSDVKIHTDSKAHDMAEGINAKAFTHEQDIYFKQGNFDTSSTEGKELLAHELAHTQQQKNGLNRKIQRQAIKKKDPPKPDINILAAIDYNKEIGVNISASAEEFYRLAGKEYEEYYQKIKGGAADNGEPFVYLVYGAQKTLFSDQSELWDGRYTGDTLNAKNQWFQDSIKYNNEFYEFNPDLLNSLLNVTHDTLLGEAINNDSPKISKNFSLLVLEVQQTLFQNDPLQRDGKLTPGLYDAVQTFYKSVTLDTVEIIGQWGGDLDKLVIDIHDNLNDKNKLNGVIPTSLSPTEKENLEAKYEAKYNSKIPTDVASNFLPSSKAASWFTKEKSVAQILAKTSNLRKEIDTTAGMVSIKREAANVVVIDNEVSYKFNGTFKNAPRQLQMDQSGTHEEYINPRTYTPRVVEWYAISVDGADFDKKHVYSAEDEDYSFTPNQKGLYNILAVVAVGQNFEILKETIQVVAKEEIATQQFAILGNNDNAYSNYVFNLEFARQELSKGVSGSQPNSKIQIVDGYNPFYGQKDYLRPLVYGLKKEPLDATSYRWYAVPENQNILQYQEGAEKIGIKNQYVASSKKESKVFDVITVNGQKAILGYSGGNFDLNEEGVYTIYCESYDKEGQLIDVASYKQAVLTPENYDKLKAVNKFMVTLDERISEIEDKTLEALPAVYINKTTSQPSVIPLFIGKSKTDPKKWLLLDLTPNIDKSKFEGASVAEAIDDFDDNNTYPKGDIYIKYKGINFNLETTGSTDYETWSRTAGTASLGLAIVGGILAFLAPPVGVTLLSIAAATAADLAIATAIISDITSLADNAEKDDPDSTLTAVNVLGIVGSLLAIGKVTKFFAATEGILLAGKAGRLYSVTEIAVQGVQTVLLTKMAGEQLDAVNEQAEKQHWTKEQTQTATLRLFAQLVVSHSMVIYSAYHFKGDKRGLFKKGLSEEEISQMKPDEVILINQLGRDEIAQVGLKGADRIQRLKELAMTKYQKALNIYGVDESKLTLVRNAKGELTYPRNAQQFAGKVYTFDPNAPHIQERIRTSSNPTQTRAELAELFEKYPNGVRFTQEGFPDFSPYTMNYHGFEVEVDINSLTATSSQDFIRANQEMSNRFPEWVQPEGYTWHHVENTTKLQLVPTDLHKNLGHTGGRATN